MGQVTANGIDISYDVHGVGGRGTILLVCGTGQAAAVWTDLGTTGGLTEAGYQVVTFDNRGMVGAACPAPPWTVGDMADDALAVLEAVGASHVLGASLGALITQTVTLRRPDLVRTATFMIGGGQFGPAWGPLMLGLVDLYASGAGLPQGIERFMMLQAFLTPTQRSDPAMVELAVALTSGLTKSFGPGGQHGQYSACATWVDEDHISELAGVQVPVLVLANELDPVFPTPGLRAVAAAVPDGTYVELPGASHIAIDPATVQAGLDALLPFLAAH